MGRNTQIQSSKKGMVLPGAEEKISQVKEARPVLHMENRWLEKIIQLFIEIRIISVNNTRKPNEIVYILMYHLKMNSISFSLLFLLLLSKRNLFVFI